MGQTPLIHCLSRLDAVENTYDNRNICLLIATCLLENGADINKYSMGQTYLMTFCAISMKLDQAQLETNLIVIKFLMEHGADPNLKCENTKQDCFALSENHVASQQVQDIMANTA